MKRTYKYALSAVLGLGLAVPALAQTGFPDVKDSHWAADSVNRLKLSGLVHGFKDGEYKGDRTMTRYEMASAVYAIYAKLVCFNEEVEKKIKALEAKINSIKPNEPAPAPDLSDIRAAISSMKSDVGTIKAWGSDLAQLKKMSSAYANELKSLGADVKDMQKNISDVQARVAKLEMAPSGMTITGDANFWMGASGTNGVFSVPNQDGMFIPSNPSGAGIDNFTPLHEFGIKIEDKKASIPYTAEIVAGNTMGENRNKFAILSSGGGFGSQSYSESNLGHAITSGNDSVWINELTAKYRPFNLTVGRQGMRLNRFILQRPDITSFFMNSRWDDHAFRMDGASMTFANDNGKVFMGQVSNATDTNDTIFQPIFLQSILVQRMMGASYDFRLGGDKGKLSASYVDFDGGNGFPLSAQPLGSLQKVITRQNVYGLDLNYDLGGLMFEAGGGKSVGQGYTVQGGGGGAISQGLGSDTQNLDTLVDTANSRWNVAIGSHTDSHSFKIGYRNVETNYIAPGDWGRVSFYRNLTDVKAYNASGSMKLTNKIGVHGWYEKGEAIQGVGNYASWKAGVETALTSKWNADLTFESTDFKGSFKNIPDGAYSRFRTVKLAYDMGKMSSLNIFWQVTTLNNFDNQPFRAIDSGSFYGFQYSIKF